ncbi:hypothetical protein L1987_14478 [Smallanthus sonchifolius]|uniref:Uncharacterized protein n=1 Tax=Smallanthus sonchifolius TaxID=185202 RepID=A0ACB9J3Z4_9ASTR|nr:hypothetical protein L1987_14478 [Smallanthus sonchifolius]
MFVFMVLEAEAVILNLHVSLCTETSCLCNKCYCKVGNRYKYAFRQKISDPGKEALKQMDTPGCSKKGGSGFDFTRAVQGVNHGKKSQSKPPTSDSTGSALIGKQTAAERFKLLTTCFAIGGLVQSVVLIVIDRLEEAIDGTGRIHSRRNRSRATGGGVVWLWSLQSGCSDSAIEIVVVFVCCEPGKLLMKGITDAQKDAIMSRLKGPSKAVRAADMDN